MENYTVYMLISPNGKKYIGATSQNIINRWNNGKHYEHNEELKGDIAKYGWENFEKHILCSNLSKETASEKEKYYIELYKTIDKNYGYNRTSGGFKDFIFADETQSKLSKHLKKQANLRKGKKLSDEQKKYISLKVKAAMQRKEVKEKMLATYLSKEWREKNSEATKQQWKNSDLINKIKQANGKKVICIETKAIYDTLKEASIKENIERHKLSNCCNGKIETINNKHFKFI